MAGASFSQSLHTICLYLAAYLESLRLIQSQLLLFSAALDMDFMACWRQQAIKPLS